MPSATLPLTGAETVPILQSGANKKTTVAAFSPFLKSGQIALNNSTTEYTFAHGLAAAPTMFDAYFVCIADDGNIGCVAGQILSIHDWMNIAGGGATTPPWFLMADATHIYLECQDILVGNENLYQTCTIGGGAVSPADFGNFKLQFVFAP